MVRHLLTRQLSTNVTYCSNDLSGTFIYFMVIRKFQFGKKKLIEELKVNNFILKAPLSTILIIHISQWGVWGGGGGDAFCLLKLEFFDLSNVSVIIPWDIQLPFMSHKLWHKHIRMWMAVNWMDTELKCIDLCVHYGTHEWVATVLKSYLSP